jgi:quercetin dioxygenase-like cupin family protein
MTPPCITLVESAAAGAEQSVIDLDIAPGTGNPTHFHTRFEETFTVLRGQLSLGLGGQTRTLHAGESVTVPVKTTHFFRNLSGENCRLRISLRPGNEDFEKAMCIYYGLKADGRLRRNGVPRSLADLAVFVYLNNSRMTGIGRVLERLLSLIAKSAIRRGHLRHLTDTYFTHPSVQTL